MNKSILAVLVCGLLMTGAVQAAAQDNTWYAGGKAGWSRYFDIDQKQVVSDPLGARQNISTSKNALGLGAFAGYQLNPNLGFEFGYDWLGKYTSSGYLSGVRVEEEAKNQMLQATMKIGFPVNDVLDLYGRIGGGYAWTNSELSAQTTTGFIKETGNNHGAVFVGALGAEYAIERDWAARIEYQYTTPLGDTSLDRSGIEMDNGLLSVGMLYRFGQHGRDVVAPAPAPAVAPAPAAVVVTRQFSLSSDVLFEFNKATLKPAARQALDTLFSQIVAANPKDGEATVIGHTDRLGSHAHNQTLSEQRARSVADYLIARGLVADRVRVEGRGKSYPVTGNNCTSNSRSELIACLAPDRRVEVRLEGVSLAAK